MTQVLPFLWVGDIVASQTRPLLAAARIERVVDLANTFPRGSGEQRIYLTQEHVAAPVQSRLVVHVADEEEQDIGWAFSQVAEYVEGGRRSGQAVLVHCFEGKSRSVTCDRLCT